jgi:hypothetical protein
MVRHTSTVVAVPSHADTQKSPVGVAWSTNALTACSLGIRSQDSPPSHGPIALRCPGNGREPPMGTVINPQRDLMQDVGPEVRSTSQLSLLEVTFDLHSTKEP